MRFFSRTLLFVCLAVLGVCLLPVAWHRSLPASAPALLPDLPTVFAEPDVPGKVYPYSLCDGGARTPEEFVSKLDSQARAHYEQAGFDLQNVRVAYADADETGQVSVRFGNHIGRSRTVVRIRKGERLFTDGTHYARARCCNVLFQLGSISKVPFLPPAEEEQAAPLLEYAYAPTPWRPFPEVYTPELNLPGGLGTPSTLPSVANTPMTSCLPCASGEKAWPVPFPIGGIGWVGAGAGVPLVILPLPTVASGTPEPGTGELAALVLALVGTIKLFSKRRKRGTRYV